MERKTVTKAGWEINEDYHFIKILCMQRKTSSVTEIDLLQEYLSFFCKTCFSDPFTMYSVTVASVPPGPSRTTP